MKLLVAAACLTGCGPGLRDVGESEYRNPRLGDFATQLTEASRQHDVAGVRALLGDSVTVGGLWFQDMTCLLQFSFPSEVRGPKLDELARCLTTIDLAISERTDALPDVAVLTYSPGIELEARFIDHPRGPWLAWLGYVARRDTQDALPTVTASSLEALRVAGTQHGDIDDASQFDELQHGPCAFAWLKVCIDGTGAVTGAHVREATSPKAARTFAEAIRAWKFQPFMLGTQPAPVCSMVRMVYPADQAPKDQELPLPVPSEPIAVTNVPSRVLGERIEGKTLVAPDDLDKARIAAARLSRVIGAFQYCLDETGRVARVSMLRSTGLPNYDRKLINAIRSWRYRPFLDEGKPIPVCSSARFVYNQDPGRQHRRQPGMMR